MGYKTGLRTLTAALVLGALAPAAWANDPPTTVTPVVVPAAAAPEAPNAEPVKKNFDDQVICKREEKINTRLGGKTVCLTRGQWAEQAREARDLYRGLGSYTKTLH